MSITRPDPRDLFCGVSAAAVILPQAMAFGVTLLVPFGFAAAGGALAGLIAASVLCIVTGIVGGSSGLITSPTGPVLVLLSGALATLAQQGISGDALILALALIVSGAGALQMLIGLSGGGKLIKYIPYPVISGFMTGSAILMLMSQYRPLLDAAIIGSGAMRRIPASSALLTVVVIWLWPRLHSKLPGTIAGLVAGTLCFHALGLLAAQDLPANWVIGELPSLASVHLVSGLDQVGALPWAFILISALALAVLASLDTLLTAVIGDVATMTRHDANRELAGQGLGHLLAGALGGMAAAGTTGATMVAINSGGRRYAALATGVVLPLILLAGSKAGSLLPVSVLSGVILYVALRMVDLDIVAWLWHRRTLGDAAIAILVTLITVFYDLMVAVGAGVSIAIVLFIRSQVLSSVVHLRSTGKQLRSVCKRSRERRDLLEHHGDRIVLFELRGNLMFATADALLDRMSADLEGNKLIILHLRCVQQIDMTAARMLQQVAMRLADQGGQLLVCDLYAQIGLGELAEKALRQFSIDSRQIPILTFNGKDEALEYAENTLLQALGEEVDAGQQKVPLADNELLQQMSAGELGHIERLLQAHQLQNGEALFRAGDEGKSLYLVIQGEIEIRLPTTTHHYKRLATCKGGAYFGELSLLNPGRRVASAIARCDTTLLELDDQAMARLQETQPQTAIKLLRAIARIEVEHLRWSSHELQHLSEW